MKFSKGDKVVNKIFVDNPEPLLEPILFTVLFVVSFILI